MSIRKLARRAGKLLVVGMSLLVFGSFASSVRAKEYMIGLTCDRSGPTMTVGPFICQGFHDYIKLFNYKNTMGAGNKVTVMEIDHGYNVPRGVEAYERLKAAGALSMLIYGTPHVAALATRLRDDKMAGTTPGFGSAAAADGQRFPYLFPAAASYWSQGAAAVKFVMDNWKGSSKPKIAYIYYDNPAGREPIGILEDLSKYLGVEIRQYAVPAPAIEMRPQILDITRRYRADWVISHLFGRGPTVSLKEMARMGYPRNRMIGLVWAGAESNIEPAGWDTAEGYYTLQFAHVGTQHPLLDEIRDMYKAEGKPAPKEMKISVYYNRGVFIAAMHAEATRAAVARVGPNITSDDVKYSLERINGFTLGGFVPPLDLTPQDHEGGGFVKVFQVHNGGYRAVGDWFQAYRDIVMKRVMTDQ